MWHQRGSVGAPYLMNFLHSSTKKRGTIYRTSVSCQEKKDKTLIKHSKFITCLNPFHSMAIIFLWISNYSCYEKILLVGYSKKIIFFLISWISSLWMCCCWWRESFCCMSTCEKLNDEYFNPCTQFRFAFHWQFFLDKVWICIFNLNGLNEPKFLPSISSCSLINLHYMSCCPEKVQSPPFFKI